MVDYYGPWERGFHHKISGKTNLALDLNSTKLLYRRGPYSEHNPPTDYAVGGIPTPGMSIGRGGIFRYAKAGLWFTDDTSKWYNPFNLDPDGAARCVWQHARVGSQYFGADVRGAENNLVASPGPPPCPPLRSPGQDLWSNMWGYPGGTPGQVFYRWRGQPIFDYFAFTYPEMEWQWNGTTASFGYNTSYDSAQLNTVPQDMYPENAYRVEYRGRYYAYESWVPSWQRDNFEGDPPIIYTGFRLKGWNYNTVGKPLGVTAYISPGRRGGAYYDVAQGGITDTGYDNELLAYYSYHSPEDVLGAPLRMRADDTVEIPVEWMNQLIAPIKHTSSDGSTTWYSAAGSDYPLSITLMPDDIVNNRYPGYFGDTQDKYDPTYAQTDIEIEWEAEFYSAPYRFVYTTPPPVPPPPTGRIGESRKMFVQP